jgi:hypothetical protein
MLSTNQKGAIAETAIIHAAVKLGVDVYRPVVEGGRYDLIFDLGTQLARVQCKTAALRGRVISISCYSARRCAGGFVKRVYTSSEIDALAAHCADLDRCFWIPVARIDGRSGIQLRLEPSRNNQKLGINWADSYDFAATLGAEQGAIAQLGERLRGTQEVGGSIPPGSTLFPIDALYRRDRPDETIPFPASKRPAEPPRTAQPPSQSTWPGLGPRRL